MTGQKLKDKLLVLLAIKKLSLAELARRLNMKSQTLNSRFMIKDVTSGLIEDICKVLDVDITYFYETISKKPAATIIQIFTNINGGETNISEGDVTHQGSSTSEQEDRELIKQLIDQNSKLIDFLGKNK